MSLIDKSDTAEQTAHGGHTEVGTAEWRPISTAPKMKIILLFAVTDIDEDGTVHNWKMATGSWHTGWEDDEKHTPWGWDGRQLHKYDIQPTHWMPLPAPPRLEEGRR